VVCFNYLSRNTTNSTHSLPENRRGLSTKSFEGGLILKSKILQEKKAAGQYPN
jgi:hypothetical protein